MSEFATDSSSMPSGPDALAPLPRALLALAQGGAAIGLASTDERGEPIVGMGIGCRAQGDDCLRIILSESANARFLAAVAAGRAVAATFTGTRDHGAYQVKAAQARIGASCLDDRPEVERQIALLCDGLVELGFTPDQASGYTTCDLNDLISVELRPERVFVQTPGPGAGAEMHR